MTRKESAISSGLADSLAAILTLTVREENKIHLTPEQVLLQLHYQHMTATYPHRYAYITIIWHVQSADLFGCLV